MVASLPAPRWQTPLPAGVVGSWGPDVAEYARRERRVVLDRWQQRALNRALAYDARIRLVHRIYLVSAGRQNGKTEIVRDLIGWALTAAELPEWSSILGLAHDKTQARVPYRRVSEDLAPIRRRYAGRGLAVTRYLGIRSDLYGRHREYDVGSREARDTIRSLSIDLAVFDEIRTQRGYDTWQALEPTTRARPEPLVFGISTAGDDRSVVLRDWWERGIRIIDGAEPADGFGMTWYAADDDDDPASSAAIRKANPSVAEGRVQLAPVAASIRTLTTSAYRQETLNLWSSGGDEWLPAGVWARQVGRQPARAVRVVIGAEAQPSWQHATVTVAILTDAGAWVGIAGELAAADTSSSSVAPAELAELAIRVAREYGARELAFSGAAAAAPHLAAAAEEAGLEAIALGPRQIRAACALLRSELVGSRLTHAEDPLLARQVRDARPSTSLEAGDWYLSIPQSVGPIDAIRAAAWAAWQAIAPDATAAPAIH